MFLCVKKHDFNHMHVRKIVRLFFFLKVHSESATAHAPKPVQYIDYSYHFE